MTVFNYYRPGIVYEEKCHFYKTLKVRFLRFVAVAAAVRF